MPGEKRRASAVEAADADGGGGTAPAARRVKTGGATRAATDDRAGRVRQGGGHALTEPSGEAPDGAAPPASGGGGTNGAPDAGRCVVVPLHAGWYRPGLVSQVEIVAHHLSNAVWALANPEEYIAVRDDVVRLHRRRPDRYLTFVATRRAVPGDELLVHHVWSILTRWGVVNHGSAPRGVACEVVPGAVAAAAAARDGVDGADDCWAPQDVAELLDICRTCVDADDVLRKVACEDPRVRARMAGRSAEGMLRCLLTVPLAATAAAAGGEPDTTMENRHKASVPATGGVPGGSPTPPAPADPRRASSDDREAPAAPRAAPHAHIAAMIDDVPPSVAAAAVREGRRSGTEGDRRASPARDERGTPLVPFQATAAAGLALVQLKAAAAQSMAEETVHAAYAGLLAHVQHGIQRDLAVLARVQTGLNAVLLDAPVEHVRVAERMWADAARVAALTEDVRRAAE